MSNRILITGAAGGVGSVGFKVVELLRKKNFHVRAMVRRLDERSKALEAFGAEVVVADFTDLPSLHKAVSGCSRVYFGMSASDSYLEGALNMAAVAKHYNVELFVNMSQMSVAQMDIHTSSESKQQRYHWLLEQALNWSGLPVVHIRATIFLEHPFFTIFSAASIKTSSKIQLPFGKGKTSPVATLDVARVIATIFESPEDHKNKICHLTGPVLQDLSGIAAEFSRALQKPISYEEVSLTQWLQEDLKKAKLNAHVENHIATMAKLHREGFYDRSTDDVERVTGQKATSVEEWVNQNASLFTGN